MLTNSEQKILELLLPRPFEAYSMRHMSKITKMSYALINHSAHSLAKKNIIITKSIGKSLSCRLNLSAEPPILAISSLIHSQKFLTKVKFSFIIDEIKEKLNDKIYILVLFGSYAKETATKDSDIDLLFIFQNENDVEETRKKIRAVVSSTKIKIEFEIITTAWLFKMFGEKHSVGREVLEGSIVLHGAEQYYTLVKKYDQERGP